MKHIRIIPCFRLAVGLTLFTLVASGLTGCLPKEQPSKPLPPLQEKPEPKTEGTKSVKAEFALPVDKTAITFIKPTAQRSEQIKVNRLLKQATTDKKQVLLSSLQYLLNGPTPEEAEQGLFSEIPKETTLLGFEILADAININFSEEFASGGGAYSLQSRWKQVTTTVHGVYPDKKVKLLIEGQPDETLGAEGLTVNNGNGNTNGEDSEE